MLHPGPARKYDVKRTGLDNLFSTIIFLGDFILLTLDDFIYPQKFLVYFRYILGKFGILGILGIYYTQLTFVPLRLGSYICYYPV